MAEFVEHALERLLPVFEQLKSTELFTSSEISELIKKCRRYEYRVTKQNKSPDDFLCYTSYLIDIIRQVDERRDGLKYYFKYDKIDKPLKVKCAFLFRICSDRFKKLEYYQKEISFLRSANLFGNCSRAYTRLLQFYGHIPDYYAEAGRFEFFENKSAENARTILQMGLRRFPRNLTLWAALFEIELGYVKLLLERREHLFDNKGDLERKDGETLQDKDGLIDVNDDVLKLGLVKIVFDEALTTVTDEDKSALLKKFLSISGKYGDLSSNLTTDICNKLDEYDTGEDADLEEAGNSSEMIEDDNLFIVDTEGCAEREGHEMEVGLTGTNKFKKGSSILDGVSEDDPVVKKLLEKAVLQPDYDQRAVFDVIPKSKRQQKKLRKNNREQTAGNEWFSMPATELTDERRRDLELIQMRDAIDPKTHYRKPERDVLPKYFQVGRVIESKADFYASRMTKKQRKRTLVEELMADHELIARNKKRYDEIMAQKAMTRRGAFQRRGIPPKHSKRRNRNQGKADAK